MNRKRLVSALLLLTFSCNAQAVDSYRYLHVTLDTVFYGFLFLLPLVLVPLALTVWLYWRRARRAQDTDQDETK